MKKLGYILDCEEISYDEMMNINGGESVFYWIGYAIGSATKSIQSALQCSCTCQH